MKVKSFTSFKMLLVIIAILSSVNITSQELRVASFNLRYDNPNDSLNNWKYRKGTIGKLIQFHDFDIFGSQEGLEHQLEQLSDEIPHYSYIGVGRTDGKTEGEFAAIFYKEDKFEVLEKGDFWLSEDTSKPNKGWDAALPRICSWGKFREKETGLVFYVFNAHFDHIGTEARRKSSELILQKIEEIAGVEPTLLTGDFNVDQTSPSYKVLNGSSRLSDSYEEAKLTYGAEGTFNGFKPNTRTTSRIDHVFVSEDFTVLAHGILTDTYQTDSKDLERLSNSGSYPKEISLYKNKARLPSDHYPILTVLQYEN